MSLLFSTLKLELKKKIQNNPFFGVKYYSILGAKSPHTARPGLTYLVLHPAYINSDIWCIYIPSNEVSNRLICKFEVHLPTCTIRELNKLEHDLVSESIDFAGLPNLIQKTFSQKLFNGSTKKSICKQRKDSTTLYLKNFIILPCRIRLSLLFVLCLSL